MPDLTHPERPEDLAQTLSAMLPQGCYVAQADPRQTYPLRASEKADAMRPKRRAEFSAGRHAAHQALSDAGLAGEILSQGLPQGPDRAPVWPKGFIGSISHSDSACLVAVAHASAGLRAIGIDLEPANALDPELWALVLSPSEAALARAHTSPGLLAKAVFSAKEAVYKAQYTLTETFIGFEAAEIRFWETGFTLRFDAAAESLAATAQFSGAGIEGRWKILSGHILTAAWIV